MNRQLNQNFIKIIIKKTLLLLAFLILLLAIFKQIHSYVSQRELIKEFQNTNIRENLITNNKRPQMDKPYKIKDGVVYIPVLELCKNFNTNVSYKFTKNNGIEFRYKKSTYILKRGSNEVRFKNSNNVLKMEGIVVFMENTIYVPLDFVYKVLDVNVVQSSDGTVYMDNYPKKFNYSWVRENRFIAHAMGGIGGNSYTNSKEAMEHSYKRGLRVMEADISLSSDNKLLLLHSFDSVSLANHGLPVSWAKNIPTEKEFLSKKILGTYSTMNFEQVANFMKKNKDMYLVIDLKKNDLKEVEKAYKEIVRVSKNIDKSILNRIIPQIYYEEMYRPVMNIYDFKSMIFTTYRIEELEVNKIVDFSYEHGIKVVAANKYKFSNELTNKLIDRGIGLYMFTYNDEKLVNSLRNNYVSGFYTDFLPKDEIKRDPEGRVVVDKKKKTDENTNNIEENLNKEPGKVEDISQN